MREKKERESKKNKRKRTMRQRETEGWEIERGGNKSMEHKK